MSCYAYKADIDELIEIVVLLKRLDTLAESYEQILSYQNVRDIEISTEQSQAQDLISPN